MTPNPYIDDDLQAPGPCEGRRRLHLLRDVGHREDREDAGDRHVEDALVDRQVDAADLDADPRIELELVLRLVLLVDIQRGSVGGRVWGAGGAFNWGTGPGGGLGPPGMMLGAAIGAGASAPVDNHRQSTLRHLGEGAAAYDKMMQPAKVDASALDRAAEKLSSAADRIGGRGGSGDPLGNVR